MVPKLKQLWNHLNKGVEDRKIEINKINQVESQHQLEDQVTDSINVTGKATEEPRVKRRHIRKKKPDVVK